MGGAMGKKEKTPRRPAKKARCAIYTRKSSEEGLEQAFNSLDAQREACAAFILSQRHEGWMVLPTLYDDGGFSGGTIAEAIQEILQPQGVGVVIEAEHSCMTLRGVNALGSTLTTSRLLGVIRDDPRTREEFLSLVRGA
jgi:GTP cyclohydrolase I